MTEVNGNELLSYLEDAVLNHGEGWNALFALNDMVEEEEEFRAVVAL